MYSHLDGSEVEQTEQRGDITPATGVYQPKFRFQSGADVAVTLNVTKIQVFSQ